MLLYISVKPLVQVCKKILYRSIIYKYLCVKLAKLAIIIEVCQINYLATYIWFTIYNIIGHVQRIQDSWKWVILKQISSCPFIDINVSARMYSERLRIRKRPTGNEKKRGLENDLESYLVDNCKPTFIGLREFS